MRGLTIAAALAAFSPLASAANANEWRSRSIYQYVQRVCAIRTRVLTVYLGSLLTDSHHHHPMHLLARTRYQLSATQFSRRTC